MIRLPLDTVKVRIRDAIRRREMGLPAADDDGELLQRALDIIEDRRERVSYTSFCECDCHEDDE